ncbi:MAG TPA: family 16 glycoside hydrolase [Urbifossiella sp.]|jgi:hypothetical protein|nr:family 16 glycoside hydrolase [Urbifossiella sp.]
MRPALLAAAFAAVVALPAPADEKPAGGTNALFNGKDLSGFVNVNCAPGTFFVKDGELVTTGNPTGFLRTDRHYENFELDFDWMHVEKTRMANSGLFVWGDPLPAVGTPYTRGIEVQVLINYAPADGWATSHGDLFSIWGAKCTPDRPHFRGIERCLPSENRVKGGGEWNHYKVIANDGAIKLHVNGKEVSGVSKSNPRKGYLAFESEGAECHFKNVRIKELPSTGATGVEVAKVWDGHVSLFTGLDLSGWKTEGGAWKVAGGALRAAGKAPIATEKAFGRCELLFDWKVPAKAEKAEVVVKAAGLRTTTTLATGEKAGGWHRQTLRFDGDRPAAPIEFEPAEGLELMNVFVRELK